MTTVAKKELASYIGKDLGTSDWVTVDQARINEFADATLDHQYIHVDEERAKETPFGTTIAHGFLTLSLLPHLASQVRIEPENVVMGINYGLNKVRFLNPVKSGSEVRARVKMTGADEKQPGQMLITTDVTIEIKGEEKPALIAESLALFITQ